MKLKLKNLLNRIPRPLKAIVCALCAVLLGIVYYIVLGCPTLTFRQEFRRAEKIHLVGPSKIVDTMGREYEDFDKMIVGETEYGICFFGRYYNQYPYDAPFAEKQYFFSYAEKTGDITLSAAPNIWGINWSFHGFERSLPVYLFAEEPNAVRAEVEITVAGNDTSSYEGSFEKTFRHEATRSKTGVFVFWFTADDQDGLSALRYLSSATGGSPFDMREDIRLASFPAMVRLYDEDGELILETEVTVGDTKK